jgi:hypothetical protein
VNGRFAISDERGMLKSERIPALLSLLAVGLVAWLFLGSRGSEPPPPPEPTASASTLQHVNESGAFSFRYPAQWVATDQGTTSKVSAPDDSIVVTFAPGPRAGLERASDELVASVRSEYRDVEILATDQADIEENPALMVSGLGTNATGLRIRFLAIAVTESNQTYSILVFTDASADPAMVLPPTQDIVGSFRGITY